MSLSHPADSSNRVPISALLAANSVSFVGNVMSSVALPWFVLQTTGSAAKTGMTGAALIIGGVLAGTFGGPIVDRVGFKRTSVASDLAGGAAVALVPLLYFTVGLEFWQLIALVFLGSILDTPGGAARKSMLPELAREADMPIERANSAIASIPRFAQFLGPPLAGVSIALFGAGNVLFVNAASFAISAILVLFFVPSFDERKAPVEANSGVGRGYFAELSDGIKFVGKNRLILSILFVFVVANLLDYPLITVILPVYAETVYGSAVGLGMMYGAFGGGALAGTLLFGAVGHRFPRRMTFIACFVAAPPLLYLVLMASLPLGVVMASFALGGLIGGPINPIIDTVIQEHVPKEMRGRVFGVITAVAFAGAPLGLVAGGFLVEGFGLFPTILVMGLCDLAVALSMLFNPALKGMDKPAPESESERRPETPSEQ